MSNSLLTVTTPDALREVLKTWRERGETVAFVPTMGNLHAGHLHLIAEARRLADRVVASIFVNPLQFGPNEDFAAYPRTPEQDADKLRTAGTDLLFLPGVDTIYPRPASQMTYVEVPGLSDILCGAFRPGHFRGVATVVLKLFNLVQPDWAVLGAKDYQQWLIINRLVADLNVPVKLHAAATQREPGGLALSSRNAYLTSEQQNQAACLYRSLCAAADELQRGCRDHAAVEARQIEHLQVAGFTLDYFSICRRSDLALPEPEDQDLIVLVAARLGSTRLIDNLSVMLGVGSES